jgi:hypothetical protein
LYGRTAYRVLCDRSRLLLQEDGIEPIEFVRTPGEARDAWRHAYEWPGWWWRGLCLAFGRSDNATLAFFRVGDSYEVLINIVGKQTTKGSILTSQNNDVAILVALRTFCLKARKFLAGVGRLLVVVGE